MRALLYIIIVPSLVAATIPLAHLDLKLADAIVMGSGVPSYVYATGDSLRINLQPQSFTGISDLVTLGVASSPLNLATVKLTQPASPNRYYQMNLIQHTEDYSSAFSTSADVQGSYGSFSGSASAKYMESKTLTTKSSLYFMFYERQLGSVFVNSNAELTSGAQDILTKDPTKFAQVYGKYFIQGAAIGCQATATVTITAKSEYGKKDLDTTAKANYKDMISASAAFEAHMNSQKSFSHLSVEASIHGGDVPVTVSDLSDVQTKILDPLDTGGKCSNENAVVTRAIIKSWLTFPAVAELATKNSSIFDALQPKEVIPTHSLARLNSVNMKTRALQALADKCLSMSSLV